MGRKAKVRFPGRQVYDICNPERIGVVITEGDEVSEVKWLDNNRTQFVTNRYLRDVENSIILPVQINGKKCGDVTVAKDATNAEIKSAVLGLDVIKQSLTGQTPKKVIIVPQRIVNIVT